MPDQIRLAMIDDHPLLRVGVEHVLRRENDFEVVGSGSSAEDAIEIARRDAPNVMILDLSMPGGGIAAARAIRTERPDVKVVFLTVSERQEDIAAALSAGAHGYMLKGIEAPDLVRTIRRVAAGETFITPDFAVCLLGLERGGVGPANAVPSKAVGKLNAREEQILRELSLGLTNKEIARKLDLTEKTIKHYMTGIMQKLNVRNRVEAVLAGKFGSGEAP